MQAKTDIVRAAPCHNGSGPSSKEGGCRAVNRVQFADVMNQAATGTSEPVLNPKTGGEPQSSGSERKDAILREPETGQDPIAFLSLSVGPDNEVPNFPAAIGTSPNEFSILSQELPPASVLLAEDRPNRAAAPSHETRPKQIADAADIDRSVNERQVNVTPCGLAAPGKPEPMRNLRTAGELKFTDTKSRDTTVREIKTGQAPLAFLSLLIKPDNVAPNLPAAITASPRRISGGSPELLPVLAPIVAERPNLLAARTIETEPKPVELAADIDQPPTMERQANATAVMPSPMRTAKTGGEPKSAGMKINDATAHEFKTGQAPLASLALPLNPDNEAANLPAAVTASPRRISGGFPERLAVPVPIAAVRPNWEKVQTHEDVPKRIEHAADIDQPPSTKGQANAAPGGRVAVEVLPTTAAAAIDRRESKAHVVMASRPVEARTMPRVQITLADHGTPNGRENTKHESLSESGEGKTPIGAPQGVPAPLSITTISPARQIAHHIAGIAAAPLMRPEQVLELSPHNAQLKTLHLVLHPEVLGSVRIVMHLRGGALQLTIETETAGAARVIEQDRDLLDQLLGEAGFEAAATAIAVTVRDQATASQAVEQRADPALSQLNGGSPGREGRGQHAGRFSPTPEHGSTGDDNSSSPRPADDPRRGIYV
jgi:hypothetical protein